ncbi:MAG: hypothetical protein ACTSYF_06020 [Promethearchaeota archaeon]
MALLALIFWTVYYLNVLIITNKRIIDVEQHSLFRREVSEFMLVKVQDVTIEIPNFTASLFKFGNIIVQTAGEKNFSSHHIPHIREAKRLILEYSHRAQQHKT